MVDVVIRRAYANDLHELRPLCAEHAAFEQLPHDSAAHVDALAEALDGDPAHLYAWLAHVDGAAVGYASATVDFSTLDRGFFLHMDCLYVRASWRGQAIGRQLWERVRDHGILLGCRSMQWQTPSWNAPAAGFYRKLGAMETTKLRYVLSL